MIMNIDAADRKKLKCTRICDLPAVCHPPGHNCTDADTVFKLIVFSHFCGFCVVLVHFEQYNYSRMLLLEKLKYFFLVFRCVNVFL